MFKWVKWFVLFVLLLLGVGASYQYIATQFDEERFPPPGEMVDVGGYRMHLLRMGSGGPVVVLDIGFGCISTDWGLVQPEIAKLTEVVSFDRAGTGWSEESPKERTSKNMVEELHTLLQRANIPAPYVLVGHSFGGCNVQLYAATYPDEVFGLVLVDSCHHDLLKKLPPVMLRGRMRWLQNPQAVWFFTFFGVSRLISEGFKEKMVPYLPQAMRDVRYALGSTTKHQCTLSNEAKCFGESEKELASADRSLCKGKPCYILSAGKRTDLTRYGVEEIESKQYQAIWDDLQKDLAAQYEGSHHRIAERSDHMIPWHQPDLVIESIKEIIAR